MFEGFPDVLNPQQLAPNSAAYIRYSDWVRQWLESAKKEAGANHV